MEADIDRTTSFRVEPPGSPPPPPGRMTLTIANGSFTFKDETGFAIAQTTRVDSRGAFDVLAYIAPDKGAFCMADVPQNASYTWKLDGAALVLTPVDDRCADRNSILAGRWTPASSTRTLVGRQTSQKQTKTGFSLTERARRRKTVGSVAVSFTFLAGGTKRADCRATLRLTDGTLVARGKVDLARPFRLTITSGTGAYRGATGWLIAKAAGKTKTLVALHLT